jgi:hypothetical protein
MTYDHGLVLILLAVGLSPLSARNPPPQPANTSDARILLRIEFPAVKVVLNRGRTVVYESPRRDRPQPRAPQQPADKPSGGPAQARPPKEKEPGQPFSRAEVEKSIKRLRASASSATLKPEPIGESWLGLGPNPDGGIQWGPDSVAVWAGAFDYEILVTVRISGQRRVAPRLQKCE